MVYVMFTVLSMIWLVLVASIQASTTFPKDPSVMPRSDLEEVYLQLLSQFEIQQAKLSAQTGEINSLDQILIEVANTSEEWKSRYVLLVEEYRRLQTKASAVQEFAMTFKADSDQLQETRRELRALRSAMRKVFKAGTFEEVQTIVEPYRSTTRRSSSTKKGECSSEPQKRTKKKNRDREEKSDETKPTATTSDPITRSRLCGELLLSVEEK